MTSKERVLTAFARQVPDRVLINYDANAGIDARLKQHFGLQPRDGEGLRKALDVDFRCINIPYRGPKLHPDIPERKVRVDDWGHHKRWVDNSPTENVLAMYETAKKYGVY